MATYDSQVSLMRPTQNVNELSCEFLLGNSTFLKVFHNTLTLKSHALIGFHRYNFEANAKIEVF
jgi:hypothetical protein